MIYTANIHPLPNVIVPPFGGIKLRLKSFRQMWWKLTGQMRVQNKTTTNKRTKNPPNKTNKQTNNLEMKVGIFSLIECGVEGSICSSLPLLFSSVQPSTMFCQSQQTPVEPLRQCIPLKKIKIPNVCGLGCGRKTMGCLSRKVLYFSAWLSGAVWCHACFQCVRIKDSRESAKENQEFFSPYACPCLGLFCKSWLCLVIYFFL